MGHSGRRRRLAAERDTAAIVREDAGASEGELLGKKARVMGNEESGRFARRADVPGDGRGCSANSGKSEIVGDDSAPAGSAEMDALARHGPLLYLAARGKGTVDLQGGESQE